jgi:GH24 family phage-related lysozyme (muramidase)
MEFSAAGMALLKRSEGFRGRVYLDTGGVPTIGWGHRLLHPDSFPDGVDERLAAHMLACDVDDAEEAVEHLVKVPLTQGQFDALVDFVFGHYDDAAGQLLRWDHGMEAGKEVELADLEARRKEEVALWKGTVTA